MEHLETGLLRQVRLIDWDCANN